MLPKGIMKAWPVLIAILLPLAFFYQLAFTDLILGRGDTFVYFYPYWDARDTALAAGELPLWTPNIFMGAPLLANPQLGTFYPPNWLTIPLSAPDSIRISILIHVTWAILGAYLLARRALTLTSWPALLAGSVFGLGGYLGAHVEQINQLQGLSWMPWLFLGLDRALCYQSLKSTRVGAVREPPLRILLYIFPLAFAWAMQLLSGHTQTAFVSGVGLGVYTVITSLGRNSADRAGHVPTEMMDGQHRAQRTVSLSKTLVPVVRNLLFLSLAALLAIIIALPQLLPTQELISLSNRGDGLNQQEATAFSLNPALVGRGLLPSYDGQPFGEYVGYIGVMGLGLSVTGAFSGDRRRWIWLFIAGLGLFLAFGRYNPLYLPLASLPGFNLFRVPARWLALTSLATSILVGLGVQTLSQREKRINWRSLMVTVIVVGGLALLSLLSDRAADEVDGPAVPTAITYVGWGVALTVFVILATCYDGVGAIRKSPLRIPLIFILVIGELWLASQSLPYNDLTDPNIYSDTRFAVNQMRVYGEDSTPPGRLLSISNLYFDPGDRDTLQARWERIGLSQRAIQYAFTATKLQETLSPNVSMLWDVPSTDGVGGGVLPTGYYTAFTSLLLPEGTQRTVDGRLREVLAQPECRGACLSDDRWLDLTNTQYVLTDKVYDLWHQDIAYDTQFTTSLASGESLVLDDIPAFESNGLYVLYSCEGTTCRVPAATLDNYPAQQLDDDQPIIDGFTLARFGIDTALTPVTIRITSQDDMHIQAMTLVDRRTGDFVQLTPPGWERVYSADIKIYENLDMLPRAFVVSDALFVPDTWDGTEEALAIMRDPNFDPAQTVVLHGEAIQDFAVEVVREPPLSENPLLQSATITEYTPTRVVIEVDTPTSGYLVLTDAYYPGWQARDTEGREIPIYRADVMFRAVPVSVGKQMVVFTF